MAVVVDNCFSFSLDKNKFLEMSMDFENKIVSEEVDVAGTPTNDKITIIISVLITTGT